MGPSGFTQRLTMHLNGGRHHSRLLYRVVVDGRNTAITRVRTTDGSPRYRITGDAFLCADCGGEFDNLAARNAGLLEWLRTHATPHGRRDEGRAAADDDGAGGGE